MLDRLPYVVEPMTLSDVGQVMAIERVAFPTPWSARAYRYEIAENEHSTMLVVRPTPRPREWPNRVLRRLRLTQPRPVLGYAGFWLLVDDAHISTIATHPQWRRRGFGELLLISLLDRAAERDADRATLEVRVSNQAAQNLYYKYGFQIASLRRRYYADNNEDAYLMTTPCFETPSFQANLHRCRIRLGSRLQAQGRDTPNPAWTMAGPVHDPPNS